MLHRFALFVLLPASLWYAVENRKERRRGIKAAMSNLQYIFVHGLSGWGSYDAAYRRMPCWGMRGGDLIVFLRGKGFDCYAASVAPTGSARDRACELYAQLAGTRVDYGAACCTGTISGRFTWTCCP